MAKEMAAEIKRINPSLSITQFANAQPYREQALLEKFISDLQSAGLQ
jgi:hypothetical protein